MRDLTLSEAQTETVSVWWQTADGTATAEDDYYGSSGLLEISPGASVATITIFLRDDYDSETDEHFSVTLTSASYGTIMYGDGTGTILDDDAPPSVNIHDAWADEADGSITFSVTLTNPSNQTVSVGFTTADIPGEAQAGLDYSATSGSVTFSAGQTIQEITIFLNDDVLDEPDEEFLLRLENAENATIDTAEATGTINDDDVLVDVDTDSNNDGIITQDDDPSEAQPPGKILAVGQDQRKEVQLKVDMDGAEPSQFTFALGYDATKIKLYDTPQSAPGNPPSGNVIPPGEITGTTRVTVSGLLAGVAVYVDGIALGASDITLTATRNSDGATRSDTVRVTVALDLDTDSDNDGTVETTDRTEDDKEDAIGGVGKRIFINKDDDNTNGKADALDTKAAYTDPEPDINDNDFAEIRLAFTGAGSAALDGYSLWLGADAGLTVWGDKRKTPLSDLPDAPDRTSNLWYIWDIDSQGVSIPATLYIEGTELGGKEVFWRLVKPGGSANSDDVLARDTITINVEKIVWPFTTQPVENWYSLATSSWVGLEVADAWYINKALVDYITTPAEKGQLETIHPDIDNPLLPGTQLTWSSRVGGLSTTTENYSDGFTMEFDYSFERSRGEGTWGYVRIDNNGSRPEKLSFVGNSGVKFGGKEVAILDVWAMVGLAGGLAAFDPSQGGGIDGEGEVDLRPEEPYQPEDLNRLMTGVRYLGDYAKMPDNPDYPNDGKPDSADEYYQTLENNYNRPNGHMKIDVTKLGGSTYTIAVHLDNEQAVSYSEDVTLTGLGRLDLQSHWGSGVIFSNMNISNKQS